MGLYDTLELPSEISLPGLDRDPSTITWQTKSIGMPAMRTFRITPDGRLLQEEFHTETVPEEERPYYGSDEWDEPLCQMAGSIRHVHDGWSERQYHGLVRFTATVEDERLAYQAKFTDGRLVAFRECDDEDGEWIPVDALGEFGTGTGGRPNEVIPSHSTGSRTTPRGDGTKGYKRTATRAFGETARVYDVSLPDDALAGSRNQGRYLQVLHVPDDRDRRDARSGEPIARGEVHEVVLREPITVENDGGTAQSVRPIVERHGPYALEPALRHAVELAASRGLPIHRDIVTLRPNWWSAASDWVTCPDCESDEIVLVTNLDEVDLTLACRACDARVIEEERAVMFREWLHCPGCTSGDVNVELSAPHGGIWWSCDDCGYDTMPASVDTAYTRVREESD